jgi:hypothetical protein
VGLRRRQEQVDLVEPVAVRERALNPSFGIRTE